jgi:Zn-finger nucleic acid-binding protein
MNDLCPDCKAELQRKFGLPAVIMTCLKCNRDWIKNFNGEIITTKDFHEKARDEQ